MVSYMKIILLFLIIISSFGYSIEAFSKISDSKNVFSVSFNPYDYSSGTDGHSGDILFGSLFRNTLSFGYEMQHLVNGRPANSLMIEFYYYEAKDLSDSNIPARIQSAYPNKEFHDYQFRDLISLNLIRRDYVNLGNGAGPIRIYSGVGAGLTFLHADYTNNQCFIMCDNQNFYDVESESLFGSLFIELGFNAPVLFISNFDFYLKSRLSYQEKIVGTFNKTHYYTDITGGVHSEELDKKSFPFLFMLGFTYSFK